MSSGELSFESLPSLRVTWTIPDFFRLAAESEYSLQSPDFLFADGRYCLRLFQFQDSDSNFLGIELLNSTAADPGRAVLCEVGLKSRTGEIDLDRERSAQQIFVIYRGSLQGKRDQNVPDGTLTVLCSVRPKIPSGAESPNSGGVVPKYRISGELSFQSFPFLYVAWRIPAFFRTHSIYTLNSPEFPFSDHHYSLQLFPSEGRKYVNVHLVKSTDTVPGRHLSYEVGFKSTTGDEIYIDHRDMAATREFYIYRSALDAMKPVRFRDGHLTVFCCLHSREPRSTGRD